MLSHVTAAEVERSSSRVNIAPPRSCSVTSRRAPSSLAFPSAERAASSSAMSSRTRDLWRTTSRHGPLWSEESIGELHRWALDSWMMKSGENSCISSTTRT